MNKSRDTSAAHTTTSTTLRTPPNYPPDLELEPVHQDINLHIDIAGEQAGGQVTTTVIARGEKPSILELDAIDFEDLSVRDPDGETLTWRYDGRKLIDSLGYAL